MRDLGKGKKPKVDDKYLRPKAAGDLLKLAHKSSQTVYISGASGFGKTSLVADFLAHKNYEYCSMNERRDINLLKACAQGNAPEKAARIIVVDDIQQLLTLSERKECYEALEALARDSKVWLILISRSQIPGWLKPLYIEQAFMAIGEQELAFSQEEARKYFDKWDLFLSKDTEERYFELSCGQPLFSRVFALRLARASANCNSGSDYIKEENAALETADIDYGEYLNTRVFECWEPDLQEFLMDLSIVDQFDLQMAQMITRKNDANRLILLAQEMGSFLTEETCGEHFVYEIRSVARQALRRRLKKRCTQTHIDNLYYSAGSCYELQGRLPEALAMYEQCRNNEAISRLLIENVRKYVGVGYYWEFRRYYLGLPEESILQSPELMSGMSLLHSVMMNDEESEKWYQALERYAKGQKGNLKNVAKGRLLYLDIALPQREVSGMKELMKRTGSLLSQRKTILPEFSVTNNQPSVMHGGKDFCEWSKRDRELSKSLGRFVEVVLGSFGKGIVNLGLAESLFEKGGDSYEISELLHKGRMQARTSGKPEMVFVATGLLAWLAVMDNHTEDAIEGLESFRTSAALDAPQLLKGIDTLKARLLLYGGRSADVAEWMECAPDEKAEFCTLERYRYAVKVRGYLAAGKRERALHLIHQLQIFAELRKRVFLQIETEILLAITQFRLGDNNWKRILQDAVSLAEEYHFVRVLSREGAALWELLKVDNIKWQDAEFKEQVMSECQHMAELYPAYLNEKECQDVLLSDKALKILRLQAEGLSTEQIAGRMNLSQSGVKYYNQETYKKLGVSSKVAAVTEARNRKMI